MKFELFRLLKKYPFLKSEILNVFLVFYEGREGFLLEGMDFPKEIRKENIKIIQNIAKKYKLVWIIENKKFQRFLITKKVFLNKYLDKQLQTSDEFLAHILGFYCVDHDFWNQNIPRWSVQINAKFEKYKFEIRVEVCEETKTSLKSLKKHGKQTVKTMTISLPPKIREKITFSYTIKLISTAQNRLQALQERNLKYISMNIEEYTDDLFNYFTYGHLANKMRKDVNKKKLDWKFYEKVWRVFVVGEALLSLRDKMNGDQINELMKDIDKKAYESGNWNHIFVMWTEYTKSNVDDHQRSHP